MLIQGRISIVVSMVVFAVLFFWQVMKARSGKLPFIRRIAGLDAIDEAIGRATELGKPVHQTPGAASVTGAATSPMIMAGISVLRYVSRKTAQYSTPLVVSVGAAETYNIADEVVRSSYLEAGKLDEYTPSTVRFLSPAQWAFTTAAVGTITREKVAANIMIGYFTAESLILAETGHAVGAIQIAGTAVMPQIPFFAVACDYCLIGEEVYAVSSYLDREPTMMGSLAGQDIAKMAAAVLLAAGAILSTIGSDFLTNLMAK